MAERQGRLSGKRCLLIGGTGGLGLAAARRFLDEGAIVTLSGHDEQTGTDAIRSLGDGTFILCDATNPNSVHALFRETLEKLGGLDILYHLAGGSGRRYGDGSLHECSEEGWQTTLELNLSTVFRTNQAAVQYWLAKQQPGAILNLASVLALAPSPHHFDTCAYSAAKAAIIALSRNAAARYAAVGIRVNVLAPGLIDTPMARRAVTNPEIVHYLRTKQPLRGGPGNPEDCAEAAVFLCSDAARFVTGCILPVDGGWCVSEGQLSGK